MATSLRALGRESEAAEAEFKADRIEAAEAKKKAEAEAKERADAGAAGE
jgi:hypothetical protein